jgi:Cd2+/Zn2+-exporting ATPase
LKPSLDSRQEFRIHGMDCAEEVAILRREIGPIAGGDANLAFDILRGKMTVLPSGLSISPQSVIQAVGRTGMRAEAWADEVPAVDTDFWQRRGRTTLTAISGLFLVLGFLVHAVSSGGFLRALGSEGMGPLSSVPLLSRLCYAVGIAAGVRYVLPKAWSAVKSLRPDMNFLMTLAVAGAIGIGEWFEAATVAFLFAVSLALESWSVGRARRAVEALMATAPPSVRVRDENGSEREISPSDVLIGQRFVVRPGERIALDGNVL